MDKYWVEGLDGGGYTDPMTLQEALETLEEDDAHGYLLRPVVYELWTPPKYLITNEQIVYALTQVAPCIVCDGEGTLIVGFDDDPEVYENIEEECANCKGKGNLLPDEAITS